jgi:hypothetical protein
VRPHQGGDFRFFPEKTRVFGRIGPAAITVLVIWKNVHRAA